jgi:hypothetical protein
LGFLKPLNIPYLCEHIVHVVEFQVQRTKQSCAELTAGFLACAEKELAAYALAVQELFGSDESCQSIEDWLGQIEWMGWPGTDAIPDWRRLTIAAAVQLATRVNVATATREPTRQEGKRASRPSLTQEKYAQIKEMIHVQK